MLLTKKVLMGKLEDKLENYDTQWNPVIIVDNANGCWSEDQRLDFAEICPIHMKFNFDAYSGQGLLNIAQELLDGSLSTKLG